MGRVLNARQRAELHAQLETVRNCPHPENRRSQIGYGIFCDVCKGRVGMISDAEAQTAMEDEIKRMVGATDVSDL
jgi:histidinol phosphatase-like enzyme